MDLCLACGEQSLDPPKDGYRGAISLTWMRSLDDAWGRLDLHRRLCASGDACFVGQKVYLFCASEGLATVFRSAYKSLGKSDAKVVDEVAKRHWLRDLVAGSDPAAQCLITHTKFAGRVQPPPAVDIDIKLDWLESGGLAGLLLAMIWRFRQQVRPRFHLGRQDDPTIY